MFLAVLFIWIIVFLLIICCCILTNKLPQFERHFHPFIRKKLKLRPSPQNDQLRPWELTPQDQINHEEYDQWLDKDKAKKRETGLSLSFINRYTLGRYSGRPNLVAQPTK